jgi:hypothetical protein
MIIDVQELARQMLADYDARTVETPGNNTPEANSRIRVTFAFGPPILHRWVRRPILIAPARRLTGLQQSSDSGILL